MRYISVCSGIEAASVAWKPLGWEAIAFSEIEAFPNAVLAYRFPDVPNLGDISKVDWSKYHGAVDLVVGGTPCQSFSVAGKREGMDGASGLVCEYFRLLSECKPKWFVWENVPGVVSSNGGADWLFILREWHKLGYHVAFRVLDAQYSGVPQRRRRIFAVGCLGDWRPPAKVLFESYSLQRHPAPSRKARQADPGAAERGVGKAGGELAGCVSSKWAKGTGGPAGDECYNLVCTQYGDKAGALRARYDSSPCADNGQNIVFEPGVMSRDGGHVYEDIAPTLRADPGDNRPTVAYGITTDRHAVAECYSFDSLASNSMKSSNPDSGCRKVDVAKTLDTSNGDPSKNQGGIAVCYPINTMVATRHMADDGRTCLGIGEDGDPQFTLSSAHEHAVCCTAPLVLKDREGKQGGGKGILIGEDKSFTLSCSQDQSLFNKAAVRRLTPTECERLQGFPDGWTDIPYKGKPAPDGARYKALGNSMAVPCMAWIGKRIQMAEDGEL